MTDWIIVKMNKFCPGLVVFIGERIYYFAKIATEGETGTIVEDVEIELSEEIMEEIDEVKEVELNETAEISDNEEIMEDIKGRIMCKCFGSRSVLEK